uniref:Uncharacterized protein n=1 Tax=Romanomermis culicivorax TaxID=13658 RepID=A0A915L5U6_ROMCU
MNPELHKRLIDRTADFYRAGNSLAAIVQHLFGVHLDKGFQDSDVERTNHDVEMSHEKGAVIARNFRFPPTRRMASTDVLERLE